MCEKRTQFLKRRYLIAITGPVCMVVSRIIKHTRAHTRCGRTRDHTLRKRVADISAK